MTLLCPCDYLYKTIAIRCFVFSIRGGSSNTRAMIYLLGWAFNYLLFFTPERYITKRRATVIAILALGAIAVLRGRVGPDTGGTYESMASHISTVHDIEPVFVGLLTLLVAVFPNPLLAVTMGLSCVHILLLLIYAKRADSHELFILQAIYIPVAFYQQITSALRFGIAFAVLLLFTQAMRRKHFKWAIILAAVAIFTHYSAALFLVFWLGATIEYGKCRRLAFAAVPLACIAAAAFYGQTQLLQKFSLYFLQEFKAPSSMSGLSSIVVTSFILLGVIESSLWTIEKLKIVTFGLLGLGMSWWITQYSYGGLRLLSIIELVVPYATLMIYQRHRLRIGTHLRVLMVAAGLMGACFVYRNMLDETTVIRTTSPSLPYKFVWDEF
jgi:hypothetical protein